MQYDMLVGGLGGFKKMEQTMLSIDSCVDNNS